MDNQSEYYIQTAIETLQNKLTIIVIAHRLDTIKKAHRLFEVNNGRVIEIKYNDYVNKLNNKLSKINK